MYFRASDKNELDQIYQILDELEPVENDPMQFRPRKALYYWPLSGAFILISILLVSRLTGRVGR